MRLNYQSFEFVLKPEENIILPAYKGSTFRGGFGNVFKRVVCALKKNDCKDCLLKEKCIYSYVFETPPPAETKVMKKYTAAPHPFIIEPPLEFKRAYTSNDTIIFSLVLIGKALEYLPYFIYTFNELGSIGVGKGKGKYVLERVSAGESVIYSSETKVINPFSKITCSIPFESIFEACSQKTRITLEFLTPTRIVRNADLVLDLEFDVLIRQLLRRIALLAYFHEGQDTSLIDFKGIIEKAQTVAVAGRHLKWYDWERYSSRKDTKMKMGGFTGSVTFDGTIAAFMPLIKAGEALHVGKGTTFGLGKYRIVS